MIYISGLAYAELTSVLAAEGFLIRVLSPSGAVSQGLSMHPDIFMCKLGTSPRSPVFKGNESLLGPEYPADVLYNAVVTEKFMICNTRTVSRELIRAAKEVYPELVIIDVKQGYTKCNVIPVDSSHFITEDLGIAKALSAAKASDPLSGPEVLLISPGHVLLPGYDRGFIGGCCGRAGGDIWFNGDISAHPDYKSIRKMITSCGLGIRYVPGKMLLDIGSIIEGPDMTEFERDVYEAVKLIPEGRVATYGQIAELSGHPRAARAVGNALHRNPDETNVHCHRVVNSDGRLASSFGFGGKDEQRRRLIAEGVYVINYAVDLKEYGIVLKEIITPGS